MGKVILDLCAGTGAWSKPYREAGYDVRLVEKYQDVRLVKPLGYGVQGILAAPPCTYFCRMRMCRGRPTDDQFREGLAIVDACLRAVVIYKPKWWALENPEGYLREWLGEPRLKFDPWQFGDPWTKRTWIWGEFSLPAENALAARVARSLVKQHTPEGQRAIAKNSREAATTPPGFARAFFEANP